jgi:uncharacterized protein with ATP-grasp and redox domains
LRQSLDVARWVSTDPAVHQQVLRDTMQQALGLDFDQTPAILAQHIHRRLREMTGVQDPYRAVKDRMNRLALELLPAFRTEIETANDALFMAARLAIAGNIIDFGFNGNLTEAEVLQAVKQAFTEPFHEEFETFRQAVENAQSILYLADNTGEIVFDRLLIEQLKPDRVTLVVRGAPVLNDATLVDANFAGLDRIVQVIDNGSDAPGTILSDCSPDFRSRFDAADLIIAKGQGNYESLSDAPGNIFFLFKVKCAVAARDVDQPVGTQILIHSKAELQEQA